MTDAALGGDGEGRGFGSFDLREAQFAGLRTDGLFGDKSL